MAVIKKTISNITSDINEVKPGEYRDYRGNQYTVIGIAKDTETGYDAVVYTRADGQMFVMPVEIFLSKIIYNNQEVYRFSRVIRDNVQKPQVTQKAIPTVNNKKDLKQLYSIVDDYLNELKPSRLSDDEFNKYFETYLIEDLKTLAWKLFGHLQDYQFMPNVIGFWKEERRPIFENVLLGYDTHAILELYDQESLFEEFCRNFSVKNKDSKQNSWLRYSASIIDACKYLNRFKSIEEYNNYCLSFKGSIKLPIEMKNAIRGMGFALACNHLKEVGFSDYSKPDVHLRDVLYGCGYCDEDDYSVFNCVKHIADENGVTPYKVDKMIWLICSGNYYLHNFTIPPQKSELIRRISKSINTD